VAGFPAGEFRLDGDPGGIRSAAAQWSAFGGAASAAAGQIRSLDTSLFLGPEGEQYRQGLNDELPPHLDVTGRAYGKVGAALDSYATALSGLQDRMRPLAARAPGLWQALQAAQGRLSSAQDADQRHAAQTRADALTRPANQPAPPDLYHSDTGAATASLSAAQQAWNDCLTAARQVKTDLRTAIDQAARAIHDAADMRFKHNPHGFGAFLSSVGGFVKDHVAGLAGLSGVLKSLSGLTATVGHFLYNGFAHVVNGLASFGNALIQHPGDLLLTVGGMLLFDVSAGGEGLGLVLDATGVGAVIGVPANVVSAAGMATGLTMMTAGAGDAARHAASDDQVSHMETERQSGSGAEPDGEHIDYPDKASARQALDGDSRVAANRFFRDATSKSEGFRVTETGDGGHRLQFFSPANNPGYGKLYVQEIDADGQVVREYKDTLGPDGLIERKWIHGGP
jgi:hypothetical protein